MPRNHSLRVAPLGIATIILASSCQDWGPCGELGCPVTEWDAILMGANHVPPVITSARAEARFSLNRTGDSLAYTITVSTLPATAITSATLHRGQVGASLGPVASVLCGNYRSVPESVPACASLTAPGVLIEGSVPITPAQLNSLRTYAVLSNVSTKRHPSGEIRGVLRNLQP